MSDKKFHPSLKWSQNKTTLTILVDVRDLKDEKIVIDTKKVTIDYNEGSKHYYEELNLKDEVDKEKSTYSKTGFNATIKLIKAKEGFWKGCTENDKAIANLKVDWDHFEDSEEEEEPKDTQPQMNMEQMMNMQKMMGGMGGGMGGGMPGMGGMGGMPGMGGMGGGMPGMGGMGGMPDMEAMKKMMGGLGGGKDGMPDLGNLPAEEDDEEADKEANLDDLEGDIKEEK